MNPRTRSYKKREMKETQAQGASNAEALKQSQQMLFAMSYKLFELENQLKATHSNMRVLDYKITAYSAFLDRMGVSKAELNAEIVRLQEADFEVDSQADDEARGLTRADESAPAALGQVAILTIRFFKAGLELTNERIVRSKIDLGKNEIFGGKLDEQVLGLLVGQTKRFPISVGEGIDEAEVTLLGLRDAPQVQEQEAKTPASNVH